MSDTPRTEQHVRTIGADGLADGDFARQLERERNDLLAALQAALDSMDARNDDTGLDVVRQRARAAIAKATKEGRA